MSQGQARAFLAAPPPKIVICSNHIQSKGEVEEVLVHELVHAVDVRSSRPPWPRLPRRPTLALRPHAQYCVDDQDLQDCRVLACSEIRAAREAECYRSFPFEWLRKRCVSSIATRSTKNMFPTQGAACVTEVFDRCMADTRPFE